MTEIELGYGSGSLSVFYDETRFDVLAPAAAPSAEARPGIELREDLFARHDEAGLLGVSAAPMLTPVEFRDRLLACLCEAG